MSKTKLGIISAVAIAGVAVLAIVAYQARLRGQNESLRQQVSQLSRLSADIQPLSNLLAQVRDTQSSANDQLREVLRLRAEMNKLSEEKEASNRVDEAKDLQGIHDQLSELSALREEVIGLGDEISDLRGAIEELYAAGPVNPTDEPPEETMANIERQPEVAIRIIPTDGSAFAEKLKRSTAAQEGESFQEVFGRFLESNGVELGNVTGLVFDERTGRVIVRAAEPTLDIIERLTVALDEEE